MNLVEFSVSEEMIKERSVDDPTLEQSFGPSFRALHSEDINEIRVINSKYRILATSVLDNQINGRTRVQWTTLLEESITSETPYEQYSS